MRIELEEKLENVISELCGTCKSIDFVLEDNGVDFNSLDEEISFKRYVDDKIFCCESCLWWCEISEMSPNEDSQECYDCYSEEDE